jgi:hypothetical protein
MCFAQKELLNFVDALEYYFFVHVVAEKSRRFEARIATVRQLDTFVALHSEYLHELATLCLISKNTEHIFEVVSAVFKQCSDFHALCCRVEGLELLDVQTFTNEITSVNDDLEKLLGKFYKSCTVLRQFLHKKL